MNNYTVLLLRPDYIASEFGKDTYLAHVVANGVEEAQRLAQLTARDSDRAPDDDPWDNPADYHVLFTALGHLEDLSVGSTNEEETR
jgi:hypothetical protein